MTSRAGDGAPGKTDVHLDSAAGGSDTSRCRSRPREWRASGSRATKTDFLWDLLDVCADPMFLLLAKNIFAGAYARRGVFCGVTEWADAKGIIVVSSARCAFFRGPIDRYVRTMFFSPNYTETPFGCFKTFPADFNTIENAEIVVWSGHGVSFRAEALWIKINTSTQYLVQELSLFFLFVNWPKWFFVLNSVNLNLVHRLPKFLIFFLNFFLNIYFTIQNYKCKQNIWQNNFFCRLRYALLVLFLNNNNLNCTV